MTKELLTLSGMLLVGSGLGILYFKSLWFTLDRLSQVSSPARWMITSLVLRFSVLIGGLFTILHFTGVASLISATIGVLLGRTACLYQARSRIRKREILL